MKSKLKHESFRVMIEVERSVDTGKWSWVAYQEITLDPLYAAGVATQLSTALKRGVQAARREARKRGIKR